MFFFTCCIMLSVMYVLIAGITTEEHWCRYGIFCRLSHQKGLVCGAFPWRHVGETQGVKTLSPPVEGVSCDFGRGHLFEFPSARRMQTGSNRLATNSSWHRRGTVTCVKPTWTMHIGGNDDMVWAFIPGPSRCSKFLSLLKWSGISVVFFQKNVVENQSVVGWLQLSFFVGICDDNLVDKA